MTLILPASMWGADGGEPSWYAVQTSEWMERRVAGWLAAMHFFGVYLPTSLERVDERRIRRVPIFREYVFLHLGHWAENAVPILRLPNVIALIGPILEDEMRAVRWLEFELNRPVIAQRRPRRGWRRRRVPS
jgi:transcription antitermination factor NusG